MIRLIPDSVNQIVRAEEICFKFDGQPIKAHKGETINLFSSKLTIQNIHSIEPNFKLYKNNSSGILGYLDTISNYMKFVFIKAI